MSMKDFIVHELEICRYRNKEGFLFYVHAALYDTPVRFDYRIVLFHAVNQQLGRFTVNCTLIKNYQDDWRDAQRFSCREPLLAALNRIEACNEHPRPSGVLHGRGFFLI